MIGDTTTVEERRTLKEHPEGNQEGVNKREGYTIRILKPGGLSFLSYIQNDRRVVTMVCF